MDPKGLTHCDTEEIIVVGSHYGELADVFIPLFESGKPIEDKDIEKVLGFSEVTLYPGDQGDRSLIFYFERGRDSGVKATSVFSSG